MGQIISKSEDQDIMNMNEIPIQERSGRTLFGRISNNIPENDVGVCRNIKNCCKLKQKPSETSDGVFTNDAIVNTVINSFISRSNLGFKKYGKTLERTDLNAIDWVNHAQEELMDAILYLERLKQDLYREKTI